MIVLWQRQMNAALLNVAVLCYESSFSIHLIESSEAVRQALVSPSLECETQNEMKQ